MNQKRLLKKLCEINEFLYLPNEEIVKTSKVNIEGFEDAYRIGWVRSAVASIIREIEIKGLTFQKGGSYGVSENEV